ncbi:MAG: Tim44 domain-containing protein [Rhodospirillales bacterium]|nr:Tim44 domain-containing protein [Rhodospirillales bacterium]
MPADLIVYALVAAGLVFWLRSVLGTRHGEEREHSAPYLSPDADERKTSSLSPDEGPATMEDNIIALAKEPRRNYGVDNKTAENGLIDIAKADKNFDIDFFLEGSQDAFAMIVESFAEGDRETLQNLLSPQVYTAFESAITQRETRKETETTDIHAIRKAYVTAARLEGKIAYITVRFTADETTVTRDEQGEVIAGHPDRIVKMSDIWTFGRDIKSKDPSWLVYETRSDIEDDNDRVPNTH